MLLQEDIQQNWKSSYANNKSYYNKDKKAASFSNTKNGIHTVEASTPPQQNLRSIWRETVSCFQNIEKLRHAKTNWATH